MIAKFMLKSNSEKYTVNQKKITTMNRQTNLWAIQHKAWKQTKKSDSERERESLSLILPRRGFHVPDPTRDFRNQYRNRGLERRRRSQQILFSTEMANDVNHRNLPDASAVIDGVVFVWRGVVTVPYADAAVVGVSDGGDGVGEGGGDGEGPQRRLAETEVGYLVRKQANCHTKRETLFENRGRPKKVLERERVWRSELEWEREREILNINACIYSQLLQLIHEKLYLWPWTDPLSAENLYVPLWRLTRHFRPLNCVNVQKIFDIEAQLHNRVIFKIEEIEPMGTAVLFQILLPPHICVNSQNGVLKHSYHTIALCEFYYKVCMSSNKRAVEKSLGHRPQRHGILFLMHTE